MRHRPIILAQTFGLCLLSSVLASAITAMMASGQPKDPKTDQSRVDPAMAAAIAQARKERAAAARDPDAMTSAEISKVTEMWLTIISNPAQPTPSITAPVCGAAPADGFVFVVDGTGRGWIVNEAARAHRVSVDITSDSGFRGNRVIDFFTGQFHPIFSDFRSRKAVEAALQLPCPEPENEGGQR